MLSRTIFFAGAAVIASLCFCTAAKNDPAEPPPAQGQRQSVTDYYLDTCSKCHGANAEGGGGGTKSLITEDKFDQKWDKPFFDAIKNGVPDMGMEAYGQAISDEAIWAQVVHIRELQAKGLRAKNGDPKPDSSGVYHSKRQNFRVETAVDTDQGMDLPWSLDFLPDGRMLVTSRPGPENHEPGFMQIIKDSKAVGRVSGLPVAKQQGQGGLMDVDVHPDYANNGWIYLTYAEAGKPQGAMTKIVRGKLRFNGNDAQWVDQQVIWEAGDQKWYTGAGIHFGSKLVFDGKGHVFFSVGERGGNMLAQQLTTPFGKIYRLNEDGSEPSDNPFVGQAGVPKGVWSWGHRNPQGLSFDAAGNLWDTEHAPRGGDEVNLIQKGRNYGWPVVCFGINYNDTPFRIPWPKRDQDIAMPVFRWLPSIGASGFDLVKGGKFAGWEGDLMAGGLSGQNVDRFRLKDGALVEREELLHGMGRVREITTGRDGYIYVALNEPDKIIRLVPTP